MTFSKMDWRSDGYSEIGNASLHYCGQIHRWLASPVSFETATGIYSEHDTDDYSSSAKAGAENSRRQRLRFFEPK
jgi:hypothetical protein